MENSEHDNSTLDGRVERMSAKMELLRIVKHYTKLIDMIESSQQVESTTKADEESNLFN